MKLLIVAVASLAIVHCATENRRTDESQQYKTQNHRPLTNNTNKSSKYSARFYGTNVADVKDSAAKVTEVPTLQDAVRVFVTSASGYKKKQDNHQPAVTSARARKPSNSTEAQQQQQPRLLLYATTTQPTVAAGAPGTTASTNPAKVNASAASKPFTTVLVPKQMLDANLVQRDYVRGDTSFRPMASPALAYKPNIDANTIENRRMSNVAGVQSNAAGAKSVAHGFAARPVTYKVEEFVGGNDQPTVVPDGGHGFSKKQDRYDLNYVTADRSNQKYSMFSPSKQEASAKYDRLNYDVQSYEVPSYDTPKRDVPKQGSKYGYTAPETVKYEQPFHKNTHSAEKFREFYPAIELPPKDLMSYSSYNTAGKSNGRPTQIEIVGPSLDLETALGKYKEFSSPPTRFASMNSETESNGPEFGSGDVNPKHVLKSILRDMLKSKQQSEIKSGSSTTMDEFIDSYFKTHRPNVDFSLDNYDIETDMSCNLRSTKHITDGQCMTSKPIVEAVCADRCLVLASSQPFSNTRQRIPSSNQQVEALHCVDGDVKLKRVQLLCRDGNKVNNVVKVVTNCRCTLHQIQPQMRSNASPIRQMATVDPEIMQIAAAGKF